jgi:hypothetical protein
MAIERNAPRKTAEQFAVRCRRLRDEAAAKVIEMANDKPSMKPAEIWCALQNKGIDVGRAEVERILLDQVAEGAVLARRASALHARGIACGEGQSLLLALDGAGTDDAPEAVWIQLAKQGSFAGHPSGRPFKLDRGVFEQMVANFRGNKDGRLPIDFEHASERDAAEGSIPATGAPAQGWIVDMKLGEDGNLYAKVEWGALARQYIREKKYMFISPAIHFRMKDRETGKDIGAYISSAGLTNSPFLDGMRPLAARATPSASDGERIMLSVTALTSKLMTEERLSWQDAQQKASRLLYEQSVRSLAGAP